MKCSHCATELPASAIVCPNCGSSVTPQKPARAFSYLPTGAPPWPSSVPDKIPYIIDAAPAAAIATVPGKAVAAPTTSPRNLITTIGVLVLVPVLGALLTLAFLVLHGDFTSNQSQASTVNQQQAATTATAQTPAATTPTPLPTPTTFKNTTDQTLKISVDYPAEWTVGTVTTDQAGNVNLPIASPQQYDIHVSFGLLLASNATNFKSADDVNQTVIQNISQQGVTNFQTVTSADVHQPIAGLQWTQKNVTFSSGSTQYHYILLAVKQKLGYYIIGILVPDVYYQQAMQQYISHMLSSLKFLS